MNRWILLLVILLPGCTVYSPGRHDYPPTESVYKRMIEAKEQYERRQTNHGR